LQVQYVSESEYAFAFGRWKSDGRVCVTEQILRLLSTDELKAVIGHEIAHLKHMFSGGRDRGNAVLIGI